ncbi:hypothetical protein GBA52_008610 [Prunus armeniaca]|nr:hypothetical protein GBA52_008610 [Prunus armeniaca]
MGNHKGENDVKERARKPKAGIHEAILRCSEEEWGSASPISKELIETDMREELGVLSEMGSGTEEESSESESTNDTDSAAVV